MTNKYKSRRLAEVSLENGMPAETGYCRMCMVIKPFTSFHTATNTFWDRNGKMSICKDCINDAYSKFLDLNGGNIERAVLQMCRSLNVQFNQNAIEAAKKQIESKEGDPRTLFSFYKAKLVVANRSSITDTSSELYLEYEDSPVINMPEKTDVESDSMEELIKFWETDNKQDIEFLENEYSNFKQTHKADSYAEITLLKQVCYKLLDMSKDRKLGRSTDSSLKQLMDVMKNLAISPNMSNSANSGKSLDTFGMWIKDIESIRPAEWVENKNMWKDVDNLEEYTENHIISPMRSFVTGNKEFTLNGTEEVDSDDED